MIRTNVIREDFCDYIHYIKGVRKIGKSEFFRDLVLELYGDMHHGLLISMGDEDGYDHPNLQSEVCEAFDKKEDENGERGLVQIIDWLIGHRNEHSIRLLCFDTIDKLWELTCAEVLRLHYQEYKEPAKSLKAAFGGWGEGRKKAISLIREQTRRLRKAGFGLVVLGHTKFKTMTDKLSGEEYEQLTGSLESDVDAIYGDIAKIIGMIAYDVSILDKKIVDTERRMYFRSTGTIDCGSRFKHLPESIPLDAAAYVKAFNEAVAYDKASILPDNVQTELDKIKGYLKNTVNAAIKDKTMTAAEYKKLLKTFEADGNPLVKTADIPSLAIARAVKQAVDDKLNGPEHTILGVTDN